MSLQANLTAVRQQMSLNHIDAYIIGTADPHQSELMYVISFKPNMN